MFDKSTYKARRSGLRKKIDSGLLVFMGNNYVGMNYRDNTYRFRQDSSFLYFFGIDQENMCAVIDLEEGREIVFGDELTVEYIVWMGPQQSIKDKAAAVGISDTRPRKEATEYIKNALQKGRKIHILPPYRDANKIYLSDVLGTSLEGLSAHVSTELIDAVIGLRAYKEDVEIEQMEEALATTQKMHLAAMQYAKPGIREYDLTARVHAEALAGGGDLAYPIILTVNGQTLHNHYHGNELKEGQLVLGDFGAENAMHYAGDITRTFPVSKKFTARQKAIYEIVLAAEKGVIAASKPGVKYLDMHLLSARIILEGLKDVGLIKGSIEDALQAGAYGLFFPHGVGHMIGMDVHDMEDLGEDRVGYRDGLERSSLFGLRSLRLGKELEEGHVITVEPGIYFIPELIEQWKAEGRFSDFIAYDKLDDYLDFSGIRIEDDCLITAGGTRVLGPYIPKEVTEIEEIRAAGPRK
jgi:Xaa-Pro aminopeptidase